MSGSGPSSLPEAQAADTLNRLPLDPRALTGDDKAVFDWLAEHFGAPPRNFCRQLRWRTGWEAEVEIDGRRAGVLVRASRGRDVPYPMSLREEAEVHHVLERHGVRAPHVFGVIDDPLAIVMERLPGGIDSGRIADPDKRARVRGEYVEALARLHAIPLPAFAATGLPVPQGAREVALGLYARCIAIARAELAGRAFPLVTFLARWLETHAPEDRTRAAFITADAGQFLHDGEHMTGLIDFEVGYLGDPAAEFAGLRLRDTTEPLGDLAALRVAYEGLTGDTIAPRTIAYHSAGFSAVTGFLMWPSVLAPRPDTDFLPLLQFCVATSRWALQGIAEAVDVRLEHCPDPEPGAVSPFAAADHLAAGLAAMPATDPGQRYALDGAAALATYLARVQTFGEAVLAADLADARALTGKQVATRNAADAAVLDWMADAGSAGDDAALVHFHRWLQRQSFLLRGCGSQAYLTGTTLQPIG